MENTKMTPLYLMGGPPRCGKTMASKLILQRTPVIVVSTDAISDGVRNFRETTLTKEGCKAGFKLWEWTWQILIGLLKHYRNHPPATPIFVEGFIISPERAKELSDMYPKFKVRAAFVGFLDGDCIPKIYERCDEMKDWVWHERQTEDGRKEMDRVFNHHLTESRRVAPKAQELGYPFYEVKDWSAEAMQGHATRVMEYLLNE